MTSWTFVHVTDNHLGTPRSYRFRPAINKRWFGIRNQIVASNADLMLHSGDLTRDGATHEYEYQLARNELDMLPFPTFVVPGNMDVGNKHANSPGTQQWDDRDLNMKSSRLNLFASYFGPCWWSFLHKEVRFTGFCASIAGSGLPQEKRLWNLLENIPNLPRSRHHVALMHYWPFMETPDEPAWDMSDPDEYWNWYFSIDPPHRQRLLELLHNAQVDILFCGHVHTGRRVQQVEGMRLYRCPASGITAQLTERWSDSETRQGFHLCEVNDQGIEVTFVPGDDQCEEFDAFGPWGHPPVSERDYSVARENPPLQPDFD